MCVSYLCKSLFFYEGMVHLMPGEVACGQDTQFLLYMDMMSLEEHDIETQSNNILEKADLGVCFRQ